jgi:hypothetical protein
MKQANERFNDYSGYGYRLIRKSVAPGDEPEKRENSLIAPDSPLNPPQGGLSEHSEEFLFVHC